MNQIGVLIDFTPLCHASISFAKAIATRSGCKVILMHVASADKSTLKETLEANFDEFARPLVAAGISVEIALEFGKFEKVIAGMVQRLGVEMVVVGTHGVQDVKQFIFGSNILHLMQSIPAPALVVQEHSKVPSGEKAEILFPMGPHVDFIRKIKETTALSKLFNATVLLYTVLKSDAGPGEEIERNKQMTIDEFVRLNVPYEVVDQAATVYSFGYGKQILLYAKERQVQFISILSEVSDKAILGNADKERIMLNEDAIPIFSVNK